MQNTFKTELVLFRILYIFTTYTASALFTKLLIKEQVLMRVYANRGIDCHIISLWLSKKLG